MSIAEQFREEGILVGRKEGKAEAMRLAAAKFLKQGVSHEVVMQCTGISREELDKIRIR